MIVFQIYKVFMRSQDYLPEDDLEV